MLYPKLGILRYESDYVFVIECFTLNYAQVTTKKMQRTLKRAEPRANNTAAVSTMTDDPSVSSKASQCGAVKITKVFHDLSLSGKYYRRGMRARLLVL